MRYDAASIITAVLHPHRMAAAWRLYLVGAVLRHCVSTSRGSGLALLVSLPLKRGGRIGLLYPYCPLLACLVAGVLRINRRDGFGSLPGGHKERE